MTALYRRDADVMAWWTTRIECDSAVARLERDGTLTPRDTGRALKRLDVLSKSWQEVQPQEIVWDNARRLLRTHDLRAADALQLSAALIGSEGRPASLTFVCLDERLALAAEREGFQVMRG